MPKIIQLRNVPDALHRKLKARAALEGISLSDYLLAEARRAAERPTVAELRERARSARPGDDPCVARGSGAPGARSPLIVVDAAAYLALAEALDAPLVTRDARLKSAPGHSAQVELV